MHVINSQIYILAAKVATCTLIVCETSFKTVAKDLIIIICCFKQALNNSVLLATHSFLFSLPLQTRKRSHQVSPSKHSPDREVTGCTTVHFLSKGLVWCVALKMPSAMPALIITVQSWEVKLLPQAHPHLAHADFLSWASSLSHGKPFAAFLGFTPKATRPSSPLPLLLERVESPAGVSVSRQLLTALLNLRTEWSTMKNVSASA